jgi:hypothetical protein
LRQRRNFCNTLLKVLVSLFSFQTLMEMLIIGIACAAGHMLNKDGKQRRVSGERNVRISGNNQPSGPLIYDSDRVREVDEYTRDLAYRKHAESTRQKYPFDFSKPVNIVPNDLLSGEPAALGDLLGSSLYADAVPEQFARNVGTAMKMNVNTAAYDPQTGTPFSFLEKDIASTPMFRSADFRQQGQAVLSEFNQPLSLLSGQPLDMTHANMQPMFGSMVRQTGVSNDNSQVLLEKFTGVPSSDDQGTYRAKREVLNPYPNNPENPMKANITQLKDLYQRSASSVKPSHEYISPVRSFRDLPMNTDQIRILPGNLDATRSVNKKQVTYGGVMIPGQKGSTRGMLPNLRDNPYDMTGETRDFFGNKAIIDAGPIKIFPRVRNTNATAVIEGSYLAPPTETMRNRDIGAVVDRYRNTENETVTRRMEPFSPGYGGAKGRERGPHTGIIFMNDPEKGKETEYINQPHKSLGGRMRNVSSPEFTVRDLVAEKTTGPGNVTGRKYNEAWKKKNLHLSATAKAMNSENNWLSAPHKNLGMGTRKGRLQNKVTNKEMNQFSQTGNPRAKVPAHMSYDAVFSLQTNKSVKNKRYGIAKAAQLKGKWEDIRMETDPEKLMLKNYITNPTGNKKGRNREKFNDGVTKHSAKLDFGGYMNNGKYGNGDDAKRNTQMRTKEEQIVPGRMNVGLKKDKFQERNKEIEINLKDEQEFPDRQVVNRKQPAQVITDRMPVVMRTKNVEAINPRMDPGIRLTNDLYPWLRERGTNPP